MTRVLKYRRLLLSADAYCRAMSLRTFTTMMPHRAPKTVFSLTFWKEIIPKPLRSWGWPKGSTSGEWNPVTFYLVMWLLIGSMAMKQLALRKDIEDFERRTEIQLDKLREVVSKLRKGEHVDVGKALGTGDPEEEAIWAHLMEEVGAGRLPKPREPIDLDGQATQSRARKAKAAAIAKQESKVKEAKDKEKDLSSKAKESKSRGPPSTGKLVPPEFH